MIDSDFHTATMDRVEVQSPSVGNSKYYDIDDEESPLFVADSESLYKSRTSFKEIHVSPTWETLNSGINLLTLVPYRSTKSDIQATPSEWQARWLVWHFKNNETCTSEEQHVDALRISVLSFADVMKKKFGDSLNDYTLFCLPASSEQKTKDRFYIFSKLMTKYTGMESSYDKVQFLEDRSSAKHGAQRMNSNQLERCYSFDPSYFKGKKLILCDDVVSTGASLSTFKAKLESLGATVICAIALGRTIKEEYKKQKKQRTAMRI